MSRALYAMRILAPSRNALSADSGEKKSSSQFEVSCRSIPPAVRQTLISLSVVPIIALLTGLLNSIATASRRAQNRVLNVDILRMAATLGGNPVQINIHRATVRLQEVFLRAFGDNVLLQPRPRTR